MRVLAWVVISAVWIASLSPAVFADEWESALTDFELFWQQSEQNTEDAERALDDAELQRSEELFPVPEGIEGNIGKDYSLSDTHSTIKVDGVPIVLTDVPLGQWYSPYIRDTADRKIISGYRDAKGLPTGLFGPADSVTIEQLAKMAVLAAQMDLFGCIQSIKNEAAVGTWSERYIQCAEEAGWAVFSDGSVDISRPATRAEVVVTVLQAFAQRISPRSGSVFDDVTTKTTYGAAVETAATLGIVSGYADQFGNLTGMFGPEDSVNRAETAKIFSLMLQQSSPS